MYKQVSAGQSFRFSLKIMDYSDERHTLTVCALITAAATYNEFNVPEQTRNELDEFS